MQPPPGAEVPREARGQPWGPTEGGHSPRDTWERGGRGPEAETGSRGERHPAGVGPRTRGFTSLCLSCSVCEMGTPQAPSPNTCAGDSEFTPVKSQSTLGRCEPLPFSRVIDTKMWPLGRWRWGDRESAGGGQGWGEYVQRGGEAHRGWSRRGTQIPGDSGANTDAHIPGRPGVRSRGGSRGSWQDE